MWEQLTSTFSFSALWSPGLMVAAIFVAVLYLLVTGPWKNSFKDSAPFPLYKKLFFLLGVFILYIGFGGPLSLMGHLLLSIHMTEMALVYLIAPPLMIIGTPAWVLRPLLNIKVVHKLVKFFTFPIISLLLFNGLFSFYHIPEIFDYLMVNYTAQDIYKVALILSAFAMWWPLVCPVPEYDTLSGVKKLGYIFADGVLLTPACALIIFATTPLYTTYTDPTVWATAMGYCVPGGTVVPPELFSQFKPLGIMEDQQLGGIIMKIIQEISYGSALGYIFFQWARREREKDDEELQSANFRMTEV
ncbi:cytochrome c oxidase assembly factor CtaG [Guptibacillus algicola]|uniref:cytochrome c oxidase assembly factor CtaG n=1 Tax=Guptibacillus algicola TaxID=225844 RepID=UPI001CD560BD|nr:cytochrome c oxidase assembly factor CtaG [Alkalihalobacillus algicola]MCA0989081.1 cytochrome c oxidase assembly factor CtaG [Alkalihalobacillus algicola]